MPLMRVITDDSNTQADWFDTLLHHDNRGGNTFIVTERNGEFGELKVNGYNHLGKRKKEAYSKDYNCYMSLNSFAGKKRTSEALFSRGAIYVDIDDHCTKDLIELTNHKQEVWDILCSCFENGDLVPPTMLTDTGRGFGLFWVLENSIANVPAAKNSLSYCQWIQTLLPVKISEILQANDAPMTVDFAVSDVTRVVRVPGTKNQKSGTPCALRYINSNDGEPKYFSLNEIKDGCGLEEYMMMDTKTWKKIPHHFSRSVDGQYIFLQKRQQKLLEFLSLLRNDCEGRREKLLFVLYNTMLAFMGDEAEDKIYEYNQLFYNPLPEKEVAHIVREGKKKIYKFKDSYLIDYLEMSEYEADTCGFKKKNKVASNKKAILLAQKRTRNQQILEMAQSENNYTYDQIAEHFNLSIRSIKDILKKAGYQRYNKGVVRPEEEVKNNVVQTFSLADFLFKKSEMSEKEVAFFAYIESAVNNAISYGVKKDWEHGKRPAPYSALLDWLSMKIEAPYNAFQLGQFP